MVPPYTLVQLEYFLAVSQASSMTAAAEALNVTQSTLSVAINHLESCFGVELFTRLPKRGVELTPAGSRLVSACIRLLADAEDLPHVVNGWPDALTGDVAIGVYSPLVPLRAPGIIDALAAHAPQAHADLIEGDLDSLLVSLLRGECEVALMFDFGIDERFDVEVIERIPAHVIVSAQHPFALAGRTEARLAEFADEPLVILSIPHSRAHYLNLFRTAGVTPKIRYAPLGYETVRTYVANGYGYSVLNHRVEASETHGGRGLHTLELSDDLPPADLCLVTKRGGRLTARASAFIELYRGLSAQSGGAKTGDSTQPEQSSADVSTGVGAGKRANDGAGRGTAADPGTPLTDV